MSVPSRVRSLIGKACFGLGTVWAAAGALKLIFGIRVTLGLFPPLDLERVSVWPSLATGLALVFVGAWIERTAVVAVRDDDPGLASGELRSLQNERFGEVPVAVDRQARAFIHRTPPA